MISRYNGHIQSILRTNTKPEPWLHIVLRAITDYKTIDVYYAIYIWDTRQIVDQDVRRFTAKKVNDNLVSEQFDMLKQFCNASKAIDSHARLVGADYETEQIINNHIFK
jgi:hypothetical protein